MTGAGGDAAWTDRDGHPVAAPEPPAAAEWYRRIGDYQGPAYERNAFAYGTDAEVAWLRARLPLAPGTRLVDVGCGTGRHARALAAAGVAVTAVDVSAGLLRAGRTADGGDRVRWVQADAGALPLPGGSADVVVSLCQGGFGVAPGADAAALAEMARVLRPGGRLALTACSLAYAARYLGPDDALDLRRGLVHSAADVRDIDGHARTFDLWTACYSPAELIRLAESRGLRVDAVTGGEAGAFGDDPPRITDPELMVEATRG